MKPPERFPPNDPREWLNRARSNLVRAKNRIPGAYLEDLCFDAQQAAEKAIKAVMIACDIAFPYVHDLDQLLTVIALTLLKYLSVPDEFGDDRHTFKFCETNCWFRIWGRQSIRVSL